VERELAAYGAWLVRLNETQAPLQQALIRLQQRWQEIVAAGNFDQAAAEFAPFIAALIADVDRSAAALAALDTPDFPTLELEGDLRTADMRRELVRYTGQLRTVLQSYMPLLDAVRRSDRRATERAGVQLMGNVRLLLQSQILMTRAALAGAPRDEAAFNMIEVQLLFFRASERLLAAWPGLVLETRDATLAADLLRFAGEIERTAAVGESRFAAEDAEWRTELARAERDRERSAASIIRRTLAVLEVYRRIFPLGRELAAVLRAHAPGFADGRVEVAELTGLLRQLQPLRVRIDEITTDEGAALAGS
jgi:hypothetical protein